MQESNKQCRKNRQSSFYSNKIHKNSQHSNQGMHQDNQGNDGAFPQVPKSVEGKMSNSPQEKTKRIELDHDAQDIDIQSICLPKNRRQQKYQKQHPYSIHNESVQQHNRSIFLFDSCYQKDWTLSSKDFQTEFVFRIAYSLYGSYSQKEHFLKPFVLVSTGLPKIFVAGFAKTYFGFPR